MQKQSSRNKHDIKKKSKINLVNIQFTYQKTPLQILEKVYVKNAKSFTLELLHSVAIRECILLRTCNRIELYVIIENDEITTTVKRVQSYWVNLNNLNNKIFSNYCRVFYNSNAFIHLLKLASGLKSVIVGEDQILGQIKNAYEDACKIGTVGQYLKLIFEKAIRTGKKIRQETHINQGSTSIGSFIYNLLKKKYISLEQKEIIIIGAGEIGCHIGKYLSSFTDTIIFVSNRTYHKGVKLAKLIGGYAIRFDEIKDALINADIVIVATSAPHLVLKQQMIVEFWERRAKKKMLIIDLAQPRNVEETIGEIEGIELLNINHINKLLVDNIKLRKKAETLSFKLIEEDYHKYWSKFKNVHITSSYSALHKKIEKIRQEELNKCLKIIGNLEPEQIRLIKKLTQVLVKRIFHFPISQIGKDFSRENTKILSMLQNIFESKNFIEDG
ncbi:MAG: glutamyl-tRNA reductase [Candidatus Odinarchaeota archaeon]